jgi:hypothetical protein
VPADISEKALQKAVYSVKGFIVKKQSHGDQVDNRNL